MEKKEIEKIRLLVSLKGVVEGKKTVIPANSVIYPPFPSMITAEIPLNRRTIQIFYKRANPASLVKEIEVPAEEKDSFVKEDAPPIVKRKSK